MAVSLHTIISSISPGCTWRFDQFQTERVNFPLVISVRDFKQVQTGKQQQYIIGNSDKVAQ